MTNKIYKMFNSRVFYINNLEDSFPKIKTIKIYRERVDYVQCYNETEFIQRFRVSKETFQYILEKVRISLLPSSQRLVIL